MWIQEVREVGKMLHGVGEDGERISRHKLTLVRFAAVRVTLGTV